MPVFPLGSVLLPGQLMGLNVFEPRYRVMLFDLREAEPAEFVVTMIERGSEVGGGEVRTDVGCVARIGRIEEFPDGRSLVVSAGTGRVRVREWLEDDPYPRALVTDAHEGPWPGPDAELDVLVEATGSMAREVEDLAVRLGASAWPADVELSADPLERLWQLALLAPLATLDRQRLLEEDDPVARWRRLSSDLDEQRQMLSARLLWDDRG